jgi:hypothetical protein
LNQKDIKLLWGRAANRCAICKVELSEDAKSVTSSFNLGEQAHIVGEKESAARGKSPFSEAERNCYHNIILLCPTHHTLIDSNESDWPIEVLHRKKTEHELWVRETLSATEDIRAQANQLAVAAVIDAAVELCDMEKWSKWASRALSASPAWDEGASDKFFAFQERVVATIWPEDMDELRRATLTLCTLLNRAVNKFMHNADCLHGTCRPIRFYKSIPNNPNYDTDLKRFQLWLDDCWMLVADATRAANWFADVVRRDVNPMFFVESGKFVVTEGPFDDLSMRHRRYEFSSEQRDAMPAALYTSPM